MLERKFESVEEKVWNFKEKVRKCWGESLKKLENFEEKVLKMLRRKFWKCWGESLKILGRNFENIEEKVWKCWRKSWKCFGERFKILRRIWKLDDFTEFYLFSKSNCHVLSQSIYHQ